jgi:hypothetical protein
MKRWTTYSLLRLLGGGLQPPRPRPRNPLHEIGEAFSGVGLTSVNYCTSGGVGICLVKARNSSERHPVMGLARSLAPSIGKITCLE